MSAPKRGLGRGLDALLGQRAVAPGFAHIRVDAVRPNPQQPRKTFEPGALAELEQSIRELGVLVPVIVRPLGTGAIPGGPQVFELIAGERRWRASAAAHLETIPAIVREADDRSSLELAVVENLQRQDLDPIEEAMGFAHLIDEYGFTQERLAERIGKSRPAIANALRLLGLPDAVKSLLRDGGITVGHARALLAVPEASRTSLAERVVREHLTVRDVERLGVRHDARPPKGNTAEVDAGRPGADGKSADRLALEARLRYALGAPVAIVSGAGGGRIEIRFADETDLGRLVDVLLPEVS